jgi:dipeptidase E
MRDMIIASTSTLHGESYLEYILPTIVQVFKKRQISKLLFIPYARPGGLTHDEYTNKVQQAFEPHGIEVHGVHETDNPIAVIENAQAIFTGGGNTFVLVKALHDRQLIPALRHSVLKGTFYIGTSAGSNICGLTMNTTNDMPIVMPVSFKTAGVISYNINAHYLDPIPDFPHMGETREQRIAEFHTYSNLPVVGLREGSYIRVQGENELLCGEHSARIFKKDQSPVEVVSGYNFNTLN